MSAAAAHRCAIDNAEGCMLFQVHAAMRRRAARQGDVACAVAAVLGFVLTSAAQAGDLPAAPCCSTEAVRAAAARAAAKPHAAKPEDDEVDTEHIFGMTMGSDIGDKGEFELELETFSGIGKRSGYYLTTATHTHFKYTLTDNLRVAPGFTLGTHNISGVPQLEDRNAIGIHEASVEIRYKLLNRHVAPFGLTLNFEPIVSRIDDLSGRRIEGYGAVLSALMDKEWIPNKLFSALNVGYIVGASQLRGGNPWSHDSDLMISTAVSYKFFPSVLFGVEARYLQAFEGCGLDRQKGAAFYVGPTFSVALANNVGLSGTWSVQVAGKALDDPRSLDLSNFERHQALLRLTAHF
jgi:hypothetical protein